MAQSREERAAKARAYRERKYQERLAASRHERDMERIAVYDDPEFAQVALAFREAVVAAAEDRSMDEMQELGRVASDVLFAAMLDLD